MLLYLTGKSWGCYSTPSTPSSAGPEPWIGERNILRDKYLPLLKGQKQGQNNSAAAISTTAVAPPNCDDKNEKAVTQMRHLLQRERNLVSELQVRKPPYVF